MNSKLAIIIPAYKIDFIDRTLESIANQTCKDFTLYIGDDASPYDITQHINTYQSKINIVYVRFETNQGGKDLVKQWERCIRLSTKEEWIWLFSDDDLMDPKCVESFYRQINNDTLYNTLKDVYHFNTEIIDSNDKTIDQSKKYPHLLSSDDFLRKRLTNQISSFVVEYIFSRSIYTKNNGFVPLDLAWGSDHATWVKLGFDKGIQTIDGPIIKWRKSTINISTQNSDFEIVHRKARANALFLTWSIDFFKQKDSQFPLSLYAYNKYIINSLKEYYNNYGLNKTIKILLQYPLLRENNTSRLHILIHLFVFNICYKCKLVN